MSADVARYLQNYHDEVDGAALYRAMADAEESPNLALLYRRLADVEQRHADFWAEQLRQVNASVPPGKPGWRTRVLIFLAHRGGADWVLPTVAQLEHRGRMMYDDQPETADTTMRSDERSHAFLLSQVGTDPRAGTEGLPGSAIARLEGRHRSAGGNALRAAVLGANDGLVSNLSLVMGVAGVAVAEQQILLTGIAGLLAGAFSMAIGEWVSVQSSRESTARQLAIEREEIAALPEEEAEELRLIYQAKGLPEDEARTVAKRILQDPEIALDVMAREEMGIDPDELGGNPWTAALTSFVLFALGAIIPVLPFIWLTGAAAIITSLVAGGFGLFLLGAAITVFTGRNAALSGGRQLALGITAAVVTYGIGTLIGVSIA